MILYSFEGCGGLLGIFLGLVGFIPDLAFQIFPFNKELKILNVKK